MPPTFHIIIVFRFIARLLILQRQFSGFCVSAGPHTGCRKGPPARESPSQQAAEEVRFKL